MLVVHMVKLTMKAVLRRVDFQYLRIRNVHHCFELERARYVQRVLLALSSFCNTQERSNPQQAFYTI